MKLQLSALNKSGKKGIRSFFVSTLLLSFLFISQLSYAQIGTWTKVATLAPHANMGAMLLLTDGRVMCHNSNGGSYGTGWDILTPNATGSYANGTWSSSGNMNYDRLFFASQVLPSGELFAAGGEYGSGDTAGEVYNPVTNVWNRTEGVVSKMNIYDGNSELLPNGSVLVGLQSGSNPSFDDQFYTPSTNKWTSAPLAPLNHDEAEWLKLPDSSILFVGIGGVASCRYIPRTNTWVADATAPDSLYDTYGEEAGSAVLLPNGKAIFFGATGHNLIYTPSGNTSPGSWVRAPDFPVIGGNLTSMDDAPSAMMVNGRILCGVGPVPLSPSNEFRTPLNFVEYDYVSNTFSIVTSLIPGLGVDDIAAAASYQGNMVDLPDGTVLFSVDQQSGNASQQYYIYTPGSAAIAQGKPTINSILPDGCPNYKITGKLFNGISEGAQYGDDDQAASNYPLIRLTSSGGNVYYCKTTDWNRLGAVMTDSLEDTCVFTTPASLPAGTYSLVVIANGFASNPTIFTTLGITIGSHTNSGGCTPNGSATANVPTGGISPYTYNWTPSGGTNLTATGLGAGTYTITATDNNGCTATASVTITQPATTVTVTIASHVNATCIGNNGSATANTATGGVSPYTYAWAPSGGTNLTASGLSAGTYTITATDHNGCTGTASVTITQPIINVTIASSTNATCGSSNGSATANAATGGTSPYTYAWSPSGGTNLTASNLSAGTYTITATDHNGCSSTASVSISNAPSIVFSQNFEGTATIYKNGVTLTGGLPATIPASQVWGSTLTTDGNNVLHRDDTQGAWASNDDICGQPYQPPTCGANGSTYSALFDNWDANTATTGNISSPTINLGAASCGTTLSFYYYIGDCRAAGSEASLALQFNNGSGYTTVWSDVVGCTGGWIQVTKAIPNADFVANFKFQFIATAGNLSGDLYPVGVDEIVISQPCPLAVAISSKTNVFCHGGTTGSITASSATGGSSPYAYNWTPSGGTNLSATGLSAGTYTITVTDNSGCTASASATITQPGSGLGVNASVTSNVACHGGSTGGLSSTPSGGVSPYTYNWTPSGGTNITASGLSAGTYTITVTDNSGCTASASATITQPASGVSVTANVTANVTCNGASTGSVSSSPSGGSVPYTYAWSGGGSNSTKTGLTAGSYTITVHDHTGCSATASVSVTQPPVLSIASITVTNVSCHGGGNGSLTGNPGGGTSPYTYSWSGGGTNATKSGLSSGTYTLTLHDNCGASVTASATITQPAANMSVTANVTANVACRGGNTGSLSSSPSGGTTPYTYSWSGGGTNQTKTGVSAGSYTITVTDLGGCTATASATITQPATSVGVTANSTANVTCVGGNNGSASSSPSGGTLPYTYSWNGGGTNQTKTGLSAGTYTITVTDLGGCTATASVSITQPASGVTASAGIVTNLVCNGSNNASLSSSPTGGNTPYTYSWSGGGTNATKTGVSAGTYTVTVTDNLGCTSTAAVTVTQPAAMVIANYSAPPSPGSCNGISAVTVTSGGKAPYTYSWSPGGQTTDSVKTQCTGTYCCTITDNNGCVDSSCVTITSTGIATINNGSNISIYPDPNLGSFTVTGVIQGRVIEVYNDLGQNLTTVVADKSTMYFDISNRSNGIYLVRILNTNGNLITQRKIVKAQ